VKKKNLISVQTTRYSEFFRRLLQEYGTDSQAAIDGKNFSAEQFPQLIADWCVNDQIKKTRNFRLSRGKTDLFGFHDSPDEFWAAETELPFIERLAGDKLVRFRIMTCRGD
jgi:hypothetical protein